MNRLLLVLVCLIVCVAAPLVPGASPTLRDSTQAVHVNGFTVTFPTTWTWWDPQDSSSLAKLQCDQRFTAVARGYNAAQKTKARIGRSNRETLLITALTQDQPGISVVKSPFPPNSMDALLARAQKVGAASLVTLPGGQAVHSTQILASPGSDFEIENYIFLKGGNLYELGCAGPKNEVEQMHANLLQIATSLKFDNLIIDSVQSRWELVFQVRPRPNIWGLVQTISISGDIPKNLRLIGATYTSAQPIVVVLDSIGTPFEYPLSADHPLYPVTKDATHAVFILPYDVVGGNMNPTVYPLPPGRSFNLALAFRADGIDSETVAKPNVPTPDK